MILSGHKIRQQLGRNVFIDPFDESKLNPNSYNLSLHDELLVYEEVVLDMRKSNRVERVTIPPDGLVGFVAASRGRLSMTPDRQLLVPTAARGGALLDELRGLLGSLEAEEWVGRPVTLAAVDGVNLVR